MAIEKTSDGGVMFTGKDDVDTFFLVVAANRLRSELNYGLKFRGPALAPQLKKRFGWNGSKREILRQLEAELERRKNIPDVDFVTRPDGECIAPVCRLHGPRP